MELLSKTGEVVIPGLLFVFIALIILIGSVSGVGRLLGGVQSKAKAGGKTGGSAAPAGAPSPEPARAGISGETVAAIAAAVACVMEEASPGVPYVISSVSRAGSGRPVWGFAGMQQNTRPF